MAHFECPHCGALARSRSTHTCEERDVIAFEEAKKRSAARTQGRDQDV